MKCGLPPSLLALYPHDAEGDEWEEVSDSDYDGEWLEFGA